MTFPFSARGVAARSTCQGCFTSSSRAASSGVRAVSGHGAQSATGGAGGLRGGRRGRLGSTRLGSKSSSRSSIDGGVPADLVRRLTPPSFAADPAVQLFVGRPRRTRPLARRFAIQSRNARGIVASRDAAPKNAASRCRPLPMSLGPPSPAGGRARARHDRAAVFANGASRSTRADGLSDGRSLRGAQAARSATIPVMGKGPPTGSGEGGAARLLGVIGSAVCLKMRRGAAPGSSSSSSEGPRNECPECGGRALAPLQGVAVRPFSSIRFRRLRGVRSGRSARTSSSASKIRRAKRSLNEAART